MAAPLTQHARKPKSPAQVIKEDEVIFEKKHQVIYDAFLHGLEAYREWDGLKQGEEKSFAFIFDNQKRIFNNVNQEKIKPLSEENFHQLLLSVYRRMRAENLFDEKHFKNCKVQQIVGECVKDARGREVKDWITGFAKGLLPSVEWLKKIPYLGKFLGEKKEKKEKPLSDEQMVTQFLRKSLLPVVLFAITTLIFGSGPIALVLSIPGLIVTEIFMVKSLFSNDKEGTLYNPNSSDRSVACFSSHSKSIMEEATKHRDECEQTKCVEKGKEWHKKTINDISDIRQTPVKTTEKGEQQPSPAVSQTNVADGVKTSWRTDTEKRRNSATNGYQRI